MQLKDPIHRHACLNTQSTALCLFAALTVLAPVARAGDPGHEDAYRAAMHALTEGRESDARDALNRLRRSEPDSPGEWLDLAILHCILGDRAEAERLFSHIEKNFSPPDAILEIIALQRATRCRKVNARSNTRLQINRGHDSNANQGVRNPNFSIGSGASRVDLTVLPEFLPASDHYYGIDLEHRTEHASNSNYESFLEFHVKNYDTLSRLDTASLFAGLEKIWQIRDLPVRGAASAGLTTLAGKPYLYQTQLQVNTLIPSLKRNHGGVVAGGSVSRQHYPDFTDADSYILDSWTGLYSQNSFLTWQIRAGVMHDKATNNRPGGNRNGLFGGVSARFAVDGRAETEIAWQRQRWLSANTQSPGLIDQRRNQKTEIFSAAASFPLTQNMFFVTEIQFINNRENITIFEYSNRSLQLSWQYQL